MIPIPIYLIVLVQLIFISYVDIKTRKIANLWPLINYLLFIVCLFLLPDAYKLKWEAFIYPMLFIFVGFILFVLKIMGAGDTKYLSSFFILIPISLQDLAFIHLSYSTLVVGVVLFAYNTFMNFNKIKSAIILKDIRLIKSVYGKKFAFSPVICISWIVTGVMLWRNI